MANWSRREAIGLLGGAAVAARSATELQAQTSLPFQTEALTWLRRNAQPLESHDPASDTLRPIVQALDGAQVIGIGEATHGSHEDQAFKAALIRALIVQGGVRVLAVEGNRRPAGRLDDYVRGGGPDPVATVRDDFFQAWQSAEFVGLITWIRGWNMAGRPAVRIIGVGSELSSLGSDAYEAFRFVEINTPRNATPFERPLAPLIASAEARGRSAAEVAQRLSRGQWDAARLALAQLRALIAGTTRSGAEEAERSATSAIRAMDMVGGPGRAVDNQRDSAATALARERLTASGLIEQSGGARTVLWSHNLGVVAGDSGTGSQLRRRLGRGYRAVAFEYERGAVRLKQASGTAPPPEGSPWQIVSRSTPPGGLGAILGAAGPERYWVNLAPAADPPPTAFLAHPFPHDWPQLVASAQPERAPPSSVDLLVFLRQLTPSRLFPFVPGA